MSRQQPTGLLVVKYLPSVAAMAAPTVAEINAGTDLTPYRTRDGLKTPQKGSTVDQSDGKSRFNKQSAGTFGGDALEMMFYRDTKLALDVPWTLLIRGLIGVIFVARFGLAQSGTTGLGTVDGTATAGDRAETYAIEVVSREMADTAENEDHKFTSTMAITDDPELDAAVAA
jgi:hypothetical protein